MDDENSLELSLGLGLSCGKSKVGTCDSSGAEGSKGKAAIGNFASSDVSFDRFFQTSEDKEDHVGTQKHENFWTSLGKQPVTEPEGPTFRELWSKDDKLLDSSDEKLGSSKRKMAFEDANLLKKIEIEGNLTDLHGKGNSNMALKSHATDHGSSAENEDVAESEAEGPTSWLMSRRDGSGKGSDTPKDGEKPFLLNNSSLLNSLGKNQLNGKFNCDVPFSVQSMPTTVSLPSEGANATTTTTTTTLHSMASFPPHSSMQLLPLADDKQPTLRSPNSSNWHAFGYPFVQLPTLETGASWMMGSSSQCVLSHDKKNAIGGVTNIAYPVENLKTSHAQTSNNAVPVVASEGKILALTKGNGKETEEVVRHHTSQKEGEANGSNSIFSQNEVSNQSKVEPSNDSIIRPGVAPGIKFKGTGSFPDLPWVSTTGPNGKTISGVTYKYSENQIRIVCACHGNHMSSEEFIQHATSTEILDAETNTGVESFPSSNAAASAQS